MNNIKYIILLGILVFTSCGDDFFSTTLKVDPPEFEDLMVVDGHMDNVIDESLVRVSRTFESINPERRDSTLLNDAEVRIYQGSDIVDILIPTVRRDVNFVSSNNIDWQPGLEYRLEVIHPKYGVQSAVQTYPSDVQVDTVRFIENGGVDIDGYEVSKIEVEFTDPGNEENYYAIGLAYFDQGRGEFYYVDFMSLDPLVEDDARYLDLLLPDKGFNGKKYQLNLTTERYNADQLKENGIVIVKGITEDYYQYNVTLRSAIEDSDFAGFSEPALVHTNFEGALGCFTLTNAEIYSLKR